MSGCCLTQNELESEWMLFNTKWAIFQLYHGENKLHSNEIMMLSTLYLINTLSWIFIVLSLTLKQQSTGRHDHSTPTLKQQSTGRHDHSTLTLKQQSTGRHDHSTLKLKQQSTGRHDHSTPTLKQQSTGRHDHSTPTHTKY